ncbi:purine-binding chemotaxis protein CheW [Anaerobacillus alkaliphilus]|uniref:Purine-binding chemotaxis protein CheW n=1 Tax=Anaerobacillus alkaliphilus TaxID=1548597 RepID=A0A4Q0VQQ5_9BACI|nr:chemotaxis protein CheW [Anaerobacillus alkaliphilus]RXI96715.1 purine-binding chemotaxis protein CheW [Anaerobacillus alkaliphilus]
MNTNYVLFTIGSSTYGIDIKNIVSIEKVSETTPTPQMPDYMVGLVNVRGQIVPIIDCTRLLYNEGSKVDQNSRYILLETEQATLALLVESTNEIITFDSELIKPVNLYGTSSSQNYLEGVALLEDRIISIIDIEKILANVDTSSLQETN